MTTGKTTSNPTGSKPGLTRRQVMRKAGYAAGAAAFATSFPAPWVRAAGPVKIGYVSPQTGPLAPFAGADDFVIANVREIFKAQGRDIEIVVKDSQTNSNRAADVTADLIQSDGVSLVLVGAASPGFEPDEYEPPQWPEILKAYEAGDMERVAELDAEVWVVGHGRDRSEVDEGVIAEMMEMDRIILPVEERRDELLLPIDPPRAERMDQIDVPVLVIVGEHDLPDVHLSAVHLAETRSHHDAVVIPGAAHLPSLEQPEAFNRALFGFLQAFSE